MINIILTSMGGGVQPYTWSNGRLNPNIQSMFGRLGDGGGGYKL